MRSRSGKFSTDIAAADKHIRLLSDGGFHPAFADRAKTMLCGAGGGVTTCGCAMYFWSGLEWLPGNRKTMADGKTRSDLRSGRSRVASDDADGG